MTSDVTHKHIGTVYIFMHACMNLHIRIDVFIQHQSNNHYKPATRFYQGYVLLMKFCMYYVCSRDISICCAYHMFVFNITGYLFLNT